MGGGNSALESVVDLFPYASKIYLLVRSEILKGDLVTQEKIKQHPNVEIVFNAVPQEILGKDFVTGIRYKDAKTGKIKELALDGVFVEIGLVPNSDFVKDIVKLDDYGAVVVDPENPSDDRSRHLGGGRRDGALYKQNNISAGDAVKAAFNIYDHIKKS